MSKNSFIYAGTLVYITYKPLLASQSKKKKRFTGNELQWTEPSPNSVRLAAAGWLCASDWLVAMWMVGWPPGLSVNSQCILCRLSSSSSSQALLTKAPTKTMHGTLSEWFHEVLVNSITLTGSDRRCAGKQKSTAQPLSSFWHKWVAISSCWLQFALATIRLYCGKV